MTSDVAGSHLPELLSGPCGCQCYREINTPKSKANDCVGDIDLIQVEDEHLGPAENTRLRGTHVLDLFDAGSCLGLPSVRAPVLL